MNQEIEALEEERLNELSKRPNTTVLKVTHDFQHEPWSIERVHRVLDRIARRVHAFGDDVDDFVVRKTCLDDAEILAFQRCHPHLYTLTTDRKLIADPRFFKAVVGLLQVRQLMDDGKVTRKDADALATRSVLATLGGTF